MSVFAAAPANASNASSPTHGPSSAAAAGAVPPIPDGALVFDIDVILLCVVGLVFLLLLPRTAIRFTHKREWVDGHFLRSIRAEEQPAFTTRRPAENQDVISRVSPAYFDEKAGSSQSQSPDEATSYDHDYNQYYGGATSDASHTYVGQPDVSRKASTASAREKRRQNVPTHLSGWSTTLPTLAGWLRTSLNPGLTVGKAIILLGYAALVLFASLYFSNPMSDPVRTGWVAASQIPVVVILGTKNNLVGLLIGFGYERLNYIHRFAGTLLVLAANVHAIGYFYKWSISGTLAQSLMMPQFRWGMIALISFNVLFQLSTQWVRQRFYNSLFIPSHIIFAVLACVAVCNHYPVCIPYVLIAAIAYGVDRLWRLVKSRVVMARLRPLSELGMTRVEIPGINAGWRSGQHVRLRVLSLGMGWRSWAESHPFTIASVSRSPSGEGMVLMVKKAGDWTNRLYELGQRADYGEANGVGCQVQCVVEGPYGGPGHAIFASFSGALFVAGGSGITFALAAVRDLMKKDLEYRSRVRAIELVWTVQDPAALTPLLPLFSSLIAQAQSSYATLRISVHYTRAPSNPDAFKAFRALPPGLTLLPSRPKFNKVLTGVVDRSAALFSSGKERRRGGGGLSGIIVGVCGPTSLAESVRKAVNEFDPDRRKLIGGLELHEEAFGW
ncbi:iron reductase [Epithele typhae]|uniref:iron reductase n=1 Tax=Epithele typhae TaxID=378194 RepID=UPI002007E292|nr:iron reductase [Epithele typhae]KAH9915471.1 iron reductase [Epithele typhae]